MSGVVIPSAAWLQLSQLPTLVMHVLCWMRVTVTSVRQNQTP